MDIETLELKDSREMDSQKSVDAPDVSQSNDNVETPKSDKEIADCSETNKPKSRIFNEFSTLETMEIDEQLPENSINKEVDRGDFNTQSLIEHDENSRKDCSDINGYLAAMCVNDKQDSKSNKCFSYTQNQSNGDGLSDIPTVGKSNEPIEFAAVPSTDTVTEKTQKLSGNSSEIENQYMNCSLNIEVSVNTADNKECEKLSEKLEMFKTNSDNIAKNDDFSVTSMEAVPKFVEGEHSVNDTRTKEIESVQSSVGKNADLTVESVNDCEMEVIKSADISPRCLQILNTSKKSEQESINTSSSGSIRVGHDPEIGKNKENDKEFNSKFLDQISDLEMGGTEKENEDRGIVKPVKDCENQMTSTNRYDNAHKYSSNGIVLKSAGISETLQILTTSVQSGRESEKSDQQSMNKCSTDSSSGERHPEIDKIKEKNDKEINSDQVAVLEMDGIEAEHGNEDSAVVEPVNDCENRTTDTHISDDAQKCNIDQLTSIDSMQLSEESNITVPVLSKEDNGKLRQIRIGVSPKKSVENSQENEESVAVNPVDSQRTDAFVSRKDGCNETILNNDNSDQITSNTNSSDSVLEESNISVPVLSKEDRAKLRKIRIVRGNETESAPVLPPVPSPATSTPVNSSLTKPLQRTKKSPATSQTKVSPSNTTSQRKVSPSKVVEIDLTSKGGSGDQFIDLTDDDVVIIGDKLGTKGRVIPRKHVHVHKPNCPFHPKNQASKKTTIQDDDSDIEVIEEVNPAKTGPSQARVSEIEIEYPSDENDNLNKNSDPVVTKVIQRLSTKVLKPSGTLVKDIPVKTTTDISVSNANSAHDDPDGFEKSSSDQPVDIISPSSPCMAFDMEVEEHEDDFYASLTGMSPAYSSGPSSPEAFDSEKTDAEKSDKLEKTHAKNSDKSLKVVPTKSDTPKKKTGKKSRKATTKKSKKTTAKKSRKLKKAIAKTSAVSKKRDKHDKQENPDVFEHNQNDVEVESLSDTLTASENGEFDQVPMTVGDEYEVIDLEENKIVYTSGPVNIITEPEQINIHPTGIICKASGQFQSVRETLIPGNPEYMHLPQPIPCTQNKIHGVPESTIQGGIEDITPSSDLTTFSSNLNPQYNQHPNCPSCQYAKENGLLCAEHSQQKFQRVPCYNPSTTAANNVTRFSVPITLLQSASIQAKSQSLTLTPYSFVPGHPLADKQTPLILEKASYSRTIPAHPTSLLLNRPVRVQVPNTAQQLLKQPGQVTQSNNPHQPVPVAVHTRKTTNEMSSSPVSTWTNSAPIMNQLPTQQNSIVQPQNVTVVMSNQGTAPPNVRFSINQVQQGQINFPPTSQQNSNLMNKPQTLSQKMQTANQILPAAKSYQRVSGGFTSNTTSNTQTLGNTGIQQPSSLQHKNFYYLVPPDSDRNPQISNQRISVMQKAPNQSALPPYTSGPAVTGLYQNKGAEMNNNHIAHSATKVPEPESLDRTFTRNCKKIILNVNDNPELSKIVKEEFDRMSNSDLLHTLLVNSAIQKDSNRSSVGFNERPPKQPSLAKSNQLVEQQKPIYSRLKDNSLVINEGKDQLIRKSMQAAIERSLLKYSNVGQVAKSRPQDLGNRAKLSPDFNHFSSQIVNNTSLSQPNHVEFNESPMCNSEGGLHIHQNSLNIPNSREALLPEKRAGREENSQPSNYTTNLYLQGNLGQLVMNGGIATAPPVSLLSGVTQQCSALPQHQPEQQEQQWSTFDEAHSQSFPQIDEIVGYTVPEEEFGESNYTDEITIEYIDTF